MMVILSPAWNDRSPSFCAWKSYSAVTTIGFGPSEGLGLSAGGGGGARLPDSPGEANGAPAPDAGEYGGGACTLPAPAVDAVPLLFCRVIGGVNREPEEMDGALLRRAAPPVAAPAIRFADMI